MSSACPKGYLSTSIFSVLQITLSPWGPRYNVPYLHSSAFLLYQTGWPHSNCLIATVSGPCYLHWKDIYCKGRHLYITYLCCTSGILGPDVLCLNWKQEDLGPVLYSCCRNCWRVVLHSLSAFFRRHPHESWVSEGKGKGMPIFRPTSEDAEGFTSCSQTSFVLAHWWSNTICTDRGGLRPTWLAFCATACPNHKLPLFAFLILTLVALTYASCTTMTTFSLLCVCP